MIRKILDQKWLILRCVIILALLAQDSAGTSIPSFNPIVAIGISVGVILLCIGWCFLGPDGSHRYSPSDFILRSPIFFMGSMPSATFLFFGVITFSVGLYDTITKSFSPSATTEMIGGLALSTTMWAVYNFRRDQFNRRA